MSERADDDEHASEEVREVCAYFGHAAYMASCLETGLSIALMKAELMSQVYGRARKEKKAPSRAEWEEMFDAYMAKQQGLTLGTLIERIRSVMKVEPSLDAILSEALRRRNFLFHHFFRDRAVEFAHQGGRRRMVLELQEAGELFRRADDGVQQATGQILKRLGFTEEFLKTWSEDYIARELHAARAAEQ